MRRAFLRAFGQPPQALRRASRDQGFSNQGSGVRDQKSEVSNFFLTSDP
jgi:hypothetical protein